MLRGLKWSSQTELRIGRQESMDIVLQDRFIKNRLAVFAWGQAGESQL